MRSGHDPLPKPRDRRGDAHGHRRGGRLLHVCHELGVCHRPGHLHRPQLLLWQLRRYLHKGQERLGVVRGDSQGVHAALLLQEFVATAVAPAVAAAAAATAAAAAAAAIAPVQPAVSTATADLATATLAAAALALYYYGY